MVEEDASSDWRNEISDWLVGGGCLYMVAWGRDCSAWDDSVDWANLNAFDCGDIPDDHFVMTTWHDKESLTEAFWFAKYCAFHPTIELARTLIVDVAPKPRQFELMEAYRAVR